MDITRPEVEASSSMFAAGNESTMHRSIDKLVGVSLLRHGNYATVDQRRLTAQLTTPILARDYFSFARQQRIASKILRY